MNEVIDMYRCTYLIKGVELLWVTHPVVLSDLVRSQ